jgi:hypothetical protein
MSDRSLRFAANSDAGCTYIEENQARIDHIGICIGFCWNLEIREDGSALLRFSDRETLFAKCPPNSFEFGRIRDDLLSLISDNGHCFENPTCGFHRAGQHTTVSHQLLDWNLVQRLVLHAIQSATTVDDGLKDRVEQEWNVEPLDREHLLRADASFPPALLARMKDGMRKKSERDQ